MLLYAAHRDFVMYVVPSVNDRGKKVFTSEEPTADELKANGMLEAQEFLEALESACRVRIGHLRQVFRGGQFGKVKPIFVLRGQIVLPSDRTWRPLTSPELLPFSGAFVRWHRLTSDTETRKRLGIRVSLVDAVRFLKDFEASEKYALEYVPKDLRQQAFARRHPGVPYLPDRRRAKRAS